MADVRITPFLLAIHATVALTRRVGAPKSAGPCFKAEISHRCIEDCFDRKLVVRDEDQKDEDDGE